MGAPTDFPAPDAAPKVAKVGEDDNDDEHHHVSIASLRSKFETLAHGVHSVAAHPLHGLRPHRPASPAVAVTAAAAATPTQSQTPSPTSSSPVIQSGATVTSALPVSSKSVSPVSQSPASRPLPIPGAGARPPRVGSPGISAPTLAPGRSSPFTSSPLATSPVASPPKSRLPPVTTAEKPTTPPVSIVLSTPISGEPEEIGDEPAPSVKALRERFGAVSIQPRPASSSPSSSRRASFDAPRVAGSDELAQQEETKDTPKEAAGDSLSPLKRPPPPPPSSKPTLPTSTAVVFAPIAGPAGPKYDPSTAVRAKGPAPPPPTSRSASPAKLADVTAGGLTASPVATPNISRSSSPAPATSLHRPPPPPPLVAKPGASFPAAEPIPAVAEKPAVPARKTTVVGEAAPPPRPSPSAADSVPSLPPRRLSVAAPADTVPVPVPSARAVPPPPPARKVEDGQPAEASMGPPPPIPGGRPVNASTAPTSQPSDDKPAPPPRPATAAVAIPPTPPRPKAAVTPEVAASEPKVVKPPLPGNKPAAPTVIPMAAVLPIDVPKPPLPQRKPSLPPTGATPPRLPTRQNSVASITPSQASSTSTLRQGSMTDDSSAYHPPPPPTRSATSLAAVGPPPKRNGTVTAKRGAIAPRAQPDSSTSSIQRSGSGDFSEEDDDEGGPVQPINSMAQRLLDEHADSSEANRRPPHYSPDIKMSLTTGITAFAVHGKYTCVAHHQVRVFDTTFDDRPIHTLELKDTGLDFRVKDPRVTAMCFRPGETQEQEGRFVWCGTKDGHIWELDVMTGEVTSQRPSIHSAAVTHILRSHHNIITIDDIGKVHVFEVEQGIPKRDPAKLLRTIRLSDKATFAKMIRGRLWTATAPAVRSTTASSGARGPAIRVYDPCAPGTAPPPQMALTSEWAGAATSATVMPMDPDRVFLGHEGGYVSIWTLGAELECQQVLKISSTDILALEGVGERLWAGNRKGQIHVYDITPKPWIVTNLWTAHPDQPVHTLVADPWGISSTGRFMLWSCSRDVLHAWDGLLAVDWTGKRLTDRQPDYCDFREIRALVVSWNIDSAKPGDLSGPPQNVNFLNEVLHSVESPDIIVFGFQETIPLTDKKLTAKTFLFGSKGKDSGGATKDTVSGAYRAWADKLQSAVGQISTAESQYVKVHSEQLVGLFSCMFVKSSLKNSLRDVNITTVKRGIGGIYGNKGAIFARMVVDDTSICFINVHLAAGQSHKGARNADIAAIMEDKAIFPPADTLPYVRGGDGTGVLDHEMVVFSGDLNYRIDQRRDLVESMIDVGDLAYLLERDQLRREMRANHAFRLRSFAEAPITFPPTYKYDPGTDNYDSSEKRRVPAWCDRILFTRTSRLKAINYQRYEINVSDHRPISAGLAVQVKHIDPVRMRQVTKEVTTEWRVHEADILAKMAKAYEGH